MAPILCVGETLAEREAGTNEAKVIGQLEADFAGVTAEQAADIVVAYEPIWAIGTGRTASAADAQAMCKAIRTWLAQHYDAALAASIFHYGTYTIQETKRYLAERGVPVRLAAS